MEGYNIQLFLNLRPATTPVHPAIKKIKYMAKFIIHLVPE
jgi:hypothetical protein